MLKTSVLFLPGNPKIKLKTDCRWKSFLAKSKCAEGLMLIKENLQSLQNEYFLLSLIPWSHWSTEPV